jgi:glucokinase
MAVIGIDLGGTKISGAVFDNAGNRLHYMFNFLEGREGAAVGQLVIQTIRELQQAFGDTVEAVGICVPGISNAKTGLVWAPNISGWENYPLQKEVEAMLGNPNIKVKIAGDRSCYILGEIWKGAAQGVRDAVFISVGTGIGMGILANGQILDGSAGISGAAGWLALDTKYEPDYVQYGCFESNASGTGIARQAQRLLRENDLFSTSILKNYSTENVTAYEVFDAYTKNDALAVQVIEKAIQLWGMAAANVVSLLNPEMIVWGGGVFGPAMQFLDRIYEEACRWAQPIAIKQVRFEVSKLGGDAGLVGAGRLVMTDNL